MREPGCSVRSRSCSGRCSSRSRTRLSIRLWGDAIFDPLTAAALRPRADRVRAGVAPRGRRAAFALVLLLTTLAPAFMSPVDIVDIVHAAAISVPGGAARGGGIPAPRRLAARSGRIPAAAVSRRDGVRRRRHGAVRRRGSARARLLRDATRGAGGRPADADRAIVLDHPTPLRHRCALGLRRPDRRARWRRPLGYMRAGTARRRSRTSPQTDARCCVESWPRGRPRRHGDRVPRVAGRNALQLQRRGGSGQRARSARRRWRVAAAPRSRDDATLQRPLPDGRGLRRPRACGSAAAGA